MSKKKRISEKYQIWIDARRRYHLSDAQIQMARELGMNPRKFGKIANEKQEPWKATLAAFIEDIYLKRFGRDRPADVKPIEEILRANEKRKEERRKVNRLGGALTSQKQLSLTSSPKGKPQAKLSPTILQRRDDVKSDDYRKKETKKAEPNSLCLHTPVQWLASSKLRDPTKSRLPSGNVSN